MGMARRRRASRPGFLLTIGTHAVPPIRHWESPGSPLRKPGIGSRRMPACSDRVNPGALARPSLRLSAFGQELQSGCHMVRRQVMTRRSRLTPIARFVWLFLIVSLALLQPKARAAPGSRLEGG